MSTGGQNVDIELQTTLRDDRGNQDSDRESVV